MPITLYANIENDAERSKFRQSSAEIKKRLQELMADFDFEIDGFLVTASRSFRLDQVAQIFDIHPRTARRLVDSGELTGFKCRGALRITASSVEKFRKRAILEYQLQRDEAIVTRSGG